MPDDQQRHVPVYSIGAVARMLEIPTATLRTWQERYGAVVPERSKGGHRLYTRDQVEQLQFVVDQVAAGLSPADAHRLVSERLANGLSPHVRGGRGGEKLLILLAERDPFAAEFAEYFLRTEGYDVAVATDVSESIRTADEVKPHLAVVDLLMSGGNGLEVCRRLSEHGEVPVLAISTLKMRDSAMEAGASAFLLKPIEPLQLVSTVKDLLGRSAFLRRKQREDGAST